MKTFMNEMYLINGFGRSSPGFGSVLPTGLDWARGSPQWWASVTETAPLGRVTWEFFLDEFKKHYVGRIYLSNMKREFHNLKQRQMSVIEY